MEDELKLGKVTAKFAIKFILWSILFFIIGAVIVGGVSGGAIANMDSTMNGMDDVEEMFGAIKGFIYGLAIVDVVVALLATKLSTGGIAKKNKITSESRPKIVKRIAIVLAIVSIIVIIIHTAIVKVLDGMIVEGTEFDSLGELVKEAEDQSDNVGDFFGIDAEEDYDEAVKLLKSLNTAGTIYAISGLAYAVMIPVANVLLKKKEQ